MKRNIRAMWLTCLVVFFMVVSVCVIRETADASSIENEVESHENKSEAPFEAFVLGDKLYAFFKDGKDATVTMWLNEKKYPAKEADRLKKSGQYVHYFILIDASASVKVEQQKQIQEFVMKLLEDTKVDNLVTVRTLGDASATIIEEATEDDEVKRALDGIKYDEQTTNLYKGIDSTIDYIDKKERAGRGDLYRLILLTDGNPDGVTEKPGPKEVKKRVESRTDIVFDVIGVGNWNEDTEKNLPMSGRKIRVIKDNQKASEAAQELASETNKLYSVDFELSQPVSGSENIKLMLIKDGSTPRILEKKNLTVIGKEQISAETEQTEPPQKEDESRESDDGTQKDDSNDDEGQNDDEMPNDDEVQPDDPNNLEGQSDNSNDDEEQLDGQNNNEETFSQKVMKNLHDYGVFLLGGLVLCAAVIMILRKNSHKAGKIALNHLRIEVLSGKYASKKRDFSLEHTLIIGSDRKCDIIWSEFDVSEQNTRIFIHEGVIYIEDLNSSCGTVINGMRIFAPNRLRSGDIVSIGSRVQFRIFFNMQ